MALPHALTRLGPSRLLGAALLGALCACEPAPPGKARAPELVVLAAASLGDVFRELRLAHEETRPGADLLFSFAGSQTLAMQLRNGVRADLIATANPEIMESLVQAELVAAPEVFATNRLVWIARTDTSAALALSRVEDLARGGLRIVLAAPEVPAGRYARRSLEELGLLDAILAQLVSQEVDVKGVVAKLRLAGADAGAVYASDLSAEWEGEIRVLEVPEHAQMTARYPIAVVRASRQRQAASDFVAFLRSPQGRRILERHHFGAP